MDRRRLHETLGEPFAEIDRVEVFIASMSFDDYLADWKTKRATERAIAIISEASRRLPQELYGEAQHVPWTKIRGIGNVLRQDYDDVVDEVSFGIATEDLQVLKAALLAISTSLDEPEE